MSPLTSKEPQRHIGGDITEGVRGWGGGQGGGGGGTSSVWCLCANISILFDSARLGSPPRRVLLSCSCVTPGLFRSPLKRSPPTLAVQRNAAVMKNIQRDHKEVCTLTAITLSGDPPRACLKLTLKNENSLARTLHVVLIPAKSVDLGMSLHSQ